MPSSLDLLLADMVGRKPRIVIVGAGMAGLSAAHQLLQAGPSSFDLTVVEASDRIGGRIWTSEIGGDRVELGATWIHGMEGSPLYKIAEDIGALQSSTPFERHDAGLPHAPVVVAEGGLIVPPSIFCPVIDVYKKLLHQIRSHDILVDPSTQNAQSIGSYVTQGFHAFFSQRNPAFHMKDLAFDCLSPAGTLPWTVRSLQEALVSMNEYMERVDTSANTLYDLDIHAEKEYSDFPGEHVTIPGGYMSIISELAASIPAELIHRHKMVNKVLWSRPRQYFSSPVVIYCSDGSFYEADHVIVTVSLGVLKAGIERDGDVYPWASPEGRPVCRSLDDLPSGGPAKEEARNSALFDPPLPPCKIEAISRLGYGLVNKLFLQLNTSALSSTQCRQLNSRIHLLYKRCDESGDQAIPWWMRKTFSMSPIYRGSTVLLCWFAGEEAVALESVSDEEIMLGVAQTLASFGLAGQRSGGKSSLGKSLHCEFSSGSDSEDGASRRGGSQSSSSSSSDSEENYDEDEEDLCTADDFRRMFSGVLRSKWGRDPLFRGSYSFVATGASGDDIEKLAEPLPLMGGRGDGALRAGCGSSSASGKACNSTALDARDGAFNASGNAFTNALNAQGNACNAKDGVCDGVCDDTKHEIVGALCGDYVDGAFYNHDESGDNSPLQLLFAGEATVRTLYSTTHGAHLSGLREANRLLNHYSLSLSALL